MCERKPGPRCSADTYKSLVHANDNLRAVKQKLAEFEAELDFIDPHAEEEYYQETYELVEKAEGEVEDLKTKQQVAKLNYNATPEGLKLLQKRVDEAGDVTVSEHYYWHGEGYELATPFQVNITVPEKQILEAQLKAAKSHREWQHTVSKSLTEMESKDAFKALFVAEELNAKVKTLLETMRYEQGKEPARADKLVANIHKGVKTNSCMQQLTQLTLRSKEYDTIIAYLTVKHNDLNSYIQEVKNRKYLAEDKTIDSLLP